MNNQCVTPNIANCKTYDNPHVNTVTCNTCNDGFDLSSNACSAVDNAAYPNCAHVTTPNCVACKTNFVLVALTAGKKVCFDIDRDNDGLQDWDVNCLGVDQINTDNDNNYV